MPQVTFPEEGLSVSVSSGTLLIDAIRGAGLSVDAPCGGRGQCRKCAVLVLTGSAPGEQLSCQFPVTEDIEVRLPRTSMTGHILEAGSGRADLSSPNVRSVDATVSAPKIGESDSICKRVRDALGLSGPIPLSLSANLCHLLKKMDFTGNFVLVRDRLAAIRRKIRAASARARDQLDKLIRSTAHQKHLQEAIVTQRGGRYVVPVKAEYRGEVPGLVHDTSASGATVFIEPMSVVEANNEIRVLQSDEQEEIQRILLELSGEAGEFADAIIESYQYAVQLDLIFAKAQVAYQMKAVVPVIDENGVEAPAKMPVLIVIIDELAELMMTDARKDSEAYITRIAQLGRAAGVHIVVATQRPSTQIITGVIKANLPTRIAFRVGQMIDSRVILDQNGAEKLLGSGDMLFLAPGGMDLERVQGAWVKDEDLKQVVTFVSDQVPQSFNAQVVAEEEAMEEEIDENATDYDDDDYRDIAPVIKKYMRPGDDDNIRRALEVVVLDRKASTSYLQRRLKIGYNRAAEIMDLFEERGIVGSASGSGNKREILIFDGMDEE